MLTLNTLTPLLKKRKRVGRGGSRGGTSCRGHKGQNARSGGGVSAQYEGGQMPLTRRLPKRGFNNSRFRTEYTIVNLSTLNNNFDEGAEINILSLVERGIIKPSEALAVKILGKGSLEKKLNVHADAFSKSAIDAIRKHGGEVTIIQER